MQVARNTWLTLYTLHITSFISNYFNKITHYFLMQDSVKKADQIWLHTATAKVVAYLARTIQSAHQIREAISRLLSIDSTWIPAIPMIAYWQLQLLAPCYVVDDHLSTGRACHTVCTCKKKQNCLATLHEQVRGKGTWERLHPEHGIHSTMLVSCAR